VSGSMYQFLSLLCLMCFSIVHCGPNSWREKYCPLNWVIHQTLNASRSHQCHPRHGKHRFMVRGFAFSSPEMC
jgi:hypothetical protein